ncbi:MAG: hypothetical protein HY775_10035, partial [Acidobacteria bacterium]|nr:hypothetical protein [Acidobacteriota bacterium]
ISHSPGYAYTEFLITDRAWPAAYRDAKSHDVFLLDPDTAGFQFWRWSAGTQAALYDDQAGMGALIAGRVLTYAEPRFALALEIEEARAQGLLAAIWPPRTTGFAGDRL